MGRVKTAPEQLFSNGRITMRQTTREVIHEVSMGDGDTHRSEARYFPESLPSRGYNQYSVEYPQSPPRQARAYNEYNSEQLDPSYSRYNNTTNEYMVGERSYAKPVLNGSRGNGGGRENRDPSFSRLYSSNNEYMTSDSNLAGPMHRKQYIGQESNPSSSKMTKRSEYMVNGQRPDRWENNRKADRRETRPLQERRNYNATTDSGLSRVESPRDSTAPSEVLFREFRDREDEVLPFISKYGQLQRMKGVSRADSAQNQQHRKHLGNGMRLPTAVDRIDSSTIVTSNSRRSGGVARFKKTPNRRYRPGAKALLEIRRLQRSVHVLIPKTSIRRVMQEVVADLYPDGAYRFTAEACAAIQEAAEAHIVQLFEDGSSCAHHAKRVTLMTSDLHLVRKLQGW
ncbi:hypothetical protein Q1695_015358 [Nippostrongylus brasiliensis]|nr:hypothetical protein Q1695_015358 [Nippostrongylus brasiliensis]